MNETTMNETTTTTTTEDFPYENGAVIPVQWHVGFIFLAYATSFIGSYSAIRILEHGLWRSERERKNATTFSKHPNLSMSFVLSFCAIWSMHFIGMQAQELEGMDDYICYNWLETLASLFLSVAGVWAGVAVASWDVFAGSDRVHTLKYLIQSEVTVAANSNKADKRICKRHIYMVALFDLLHWITAGSLLAALGALSMHYVGMLAMRGPFRRQWNFYYVGASVAFGVIICFVGFWVLFRPLHWKVEKSWYRQASAAVIALAICFLHFFGMLSVTYIADPSNEGQCDGASSFQGWRPDQFQVLMVAMAVPLVAFFVEHTISSELRATYRRHMDINLSGSHFLSESDEDEDAKPTKAQRRQSRKDIDEETQKFEHDLTQSCREHVPSELTDGGVVTETGLSSSKDTESSTEVSKKEALFKSPYTSTEDVVSPASLAEAMDASGLCFAAHRLRPPSTLSTNSNDSVVSKIQSTIGDTMSGLASELQVGSESSQPIEAQPQGNSGILFSTLFSGKYPCISEADSDQSEEDVDLENGEQVPRAE